MDQLITLNLLKQNSDEIFKLFVSSQQKKSRSKNISRDLEVTQKIVYKFYKLNILKILEIFENI